MTLGDVIKGFREEHNLSMDEFARSANLSKAYISILERNYNPSTGKAVIPSLETIRATAVAMSMDVNRLLMLIDPDQMVSLRVDSTIPPGLEPLPKTYKVPRLGTIACGEPILAAENIETEDDVPEDIRCDFTLKCRGDSMTGARINDGDIVYIKLQPDVENGEIAAVLIDDAAEISEATLKRVYIYPEQIVLQAENPKYPPFVFAGEDMNRIRILGKAVGFTSVL